ncbi:hypothetical protein [Dactylosporangium sp. CA-233914]|uniref:WXG100-like domain-containing protein n=1 Tax=Dactylosporangium sp. CA-233914 TaxID=3239934 RepID=UPI003D928B9B
MADQQRSDDVLHPNPDALDQLALDWRAQGEQLRELGRHLGPAVQGTTWTGEAQGQALRAALAIFGHLERVAARCDDMARYIEGFAKDIREEIKRREAAKIVSIVMAFVNFILIFVGALGFLTRFATMFAGLSDLITSAITSLSRLLQGIRILPVAAAEFIATFLFHGTVGAALSTAFEIIVNGTVSAIMDVPLGSLLDWNQFIMNAVTAFTGGGLMGVMLGEGPRSAVNGMRGPARMPDPEKLHLPGGGEVIPWRPPERRAGNAPPNNGARTPKPAEVTDTPVVPVPERSPNPPEATTKTPVELPNGGRLPLYRRDETPGSGSTGTSPEPIGAGGAPPPRLPSHRPAPDWSPGSSPSNTPPPSPRLSPVGTPLNSPRLGPHVPPRDGVEVPGGHGGAGGLPPSPRLSPVSDPPGPSGSPRLGAYVPPRDGVEVPGGHGSAGGLPPSPPRHSPVSEPSGPHVPPREGVEVPGAHGGAGGLPPSPPRQAPVDPPGPSGSPRLGPHVPPRDRVDVPGGHGGAGGLPPSSRLSPVSDPSGPHVPPRDRVDVPGGHGGAGGLPPSPRLSPVSDPLGPAGSPRLGPHVPPREGVDVPGAHGGAGGLAPSPSRQAPVVDPLGPSGSPRLGAHVPPPDRVDGHGGHGNGGGLTTPPPSRTNTPEATTPDRSLSGGGRGGASERPPLTRESDIPPARLDRTVTPAPETPARDGTRPVSGDAEVSVRPVARPQSSSRQRPSESEAGTSVTPPAHQRPEGTGDAARPAAAPSGQKVVEPVRKPGELADGVDELLLARSDNPGGGGTLYRTGTTPPPSRVQGDTPGSIVRLEVGDGVDPVGLRKYLARYAGDHVGEPGYRSPAVDFGRPMTAGEAARLVQEGPASRVIVRREDLRGGHTEGLPDGFTVRPVNARNGFAETTPEHATDYVFEPVHAGARSVPARGVPSESEAGTSVTPPAKVAGPVRKPGDLPVPVRKPGDLPDRVGELSLARSGDPGGGGTLYRTGTTPPQSRAQGDTAGRIVRLEVADGVDPVELRNYLGRYVGDHEGKSGYRSPAVDFGRPMTASEAARLVQEGPASRVIVRREDLRGAPADGLPDGVTVRPVDARNGFAEAKAKRTTDYVFEHAPSRVAGPAPAKGVRRADPFDTAEVSFRRAHDGGDLHRPGTEPPELSASARMARSAPPGHARLRLAGEFTAAEVEAFVSRYAAHRDRPAGHSAQLVDPNRRISAREAGQMVLDGYWHRIIVSGRHLTTAPDADLPDGIVVRPVNRGTSPFQKLVDGGATDYVYLRASEYTEAIGGRAKLPQSAAGLSVVRAEGPGAGATLYRTGEPPPAPRPPDAGWKGRFRLVVPEGVETSAAKAYLRQYRLADGDPWVPVFDLDRPITAAAAAKFALDEHVTVVVRRQHLLGGPADGVPDTASFEPSSQRGRGGGPIEYTFRPFPKDWDTLNTANVSIYRATGGGDLYRTGGPRPERSGTGLTGQNPPGFERLRLAGDLGATDVKTFAARYHRVMGAPTGSKTLVDPNRPITAREAGQMVLDGYWHRIFVSRSHLTTAPGADLPDGIVVRPTSRRSGPFEELNGEASGYVYLRRADFDAPMDTPEVPAAAAADPARRSAGAAKAAQPVPERFKELFGAPSRARGTTPSVAELPSPPSRHRSTVVLEAEPPVRQRVLDWSFGDGRPPAGPLVTVAPKPAPKPAPEPPPAKPGLPAMRLPHRSTPEETARLVDVMRSAFGHDTRILVDPQHSMSAYDAVALAKKLKVGVVVPMYKLIGGFADRLGAGATVIGRNAAGETAILHGAFGPFSVSTLDRAAEYTFYGTDEPVGVPETNPAPAPVEIPAWRPPKHAQLPRTGGRLELKPTPDGGILHNSRHPAPEVTGPAVSKRTLHLAEGIATKDVADYVAAYRREPGRRHPSPVVRPAGSMSAAVAAEMSTAIGTPVALRPAQLDGDPLGGDGVKTWAWLKSGKRQLLAGTDLPDPADVEAYAYYRPKPPPPDPRQPVLDAVLDALPDGVTARRVPGGYVLEKPGRPAFGGFEPSSRFAGGLEGLVVLSVSPGVRDGAVADLLRSLDPETRRKIVLHDLGKQPVPADQLGRWSADELGAGAGVPVIIPAKRLIGTPPATMRVTPLAGGRPTLPQLATAYLIEPPGAAPLDLPPPHGLRPHTIPGVYQLPAGWVLDARGDGRLRAVPEEALGEPATPADPVSRGADVPLTVGEPGQVVPAAVRRVLDRLVNRLGPRVRAEQLGRVPTPDENVLHGALLRALPSGSPLRLHFLGNGAVVIGRDGTAPVGTASARRPGVHLDPSLGRDLLGAAGDLIAALPAPVQAKLHVHVGTSAQPHDFGEFKRWFTTGAGRRYEPKEIVAWAERYLGAATLVVPAKRFRTRPVPTDRMLAVVDGPDGPVVTFGPVASHYHVLGRKAPRPGVRTPHGLSVLDRPGRYALPDGWVLDASGPGITVVPPASDFEPLSTAASGVPRMHVGVGGVAVPRAVQVAIAKILDELRATPGSGVLELHVDGKPPGRAADWWSHLATLVWRQSLPRDLALRFLAPGRFVLSARGEPPGPDQIPAKLPDLPGRTLIVVDGSVSNQRTAAYLRNLPKELRDRVVLHAGTGDASALATMLAQELHTHVPVLASPGRGYRGGKFLPYLQSVVPTLEPFADFLLAVPDGASIGRVPPPHGLTAGPGPLVYGLPEGWVLDIRRPDRVWIRPGELPRGTRRPAVAVPSGAGGKPAIVIGGVAGVAVPQRVLAAAVSLAGETGSPLVGGIAQDPAAPILEYRGLRSAVARSSADGPSADGLQRLARLRDRIFRDRPAGSNRFDAGPTRGGPGARTEPRHRFADVPYWIPASSWSAVENLVRGSGPGTTAFVVGRDGRTNALYYTADRGLVWVDTTDRPRVDRPGATPGTLPDGMRFLLVDRHGKVIPRYTKPKPSTPVVTPLVPPSMPSPVVPASPVTLPVTSPVTDPAANAFATGEPADPHSADPVTGEPAVPEPEAAPATDPDPRSELDRKVYRLIDMVVAGDWPGAQAAATDVRCDFTPLARQEWIKKMKVEKRRHPEHAAELNVLLGILVGCD